MVRPVKSEHEKRDQILRTRLTLSERGYVEEQAANAGMNMAEYLRVLVLSEEVKPRKSRSDANVLTELNRIGVNLNQIAHAANIGRNDEAILRYAIDELVALMSKVNKAYS